MECTAYNGRFHASGGVTPLKVKCEYASAPPARTFVPPRLREAAGTLEAMRAQPSSSADTKKNKVESFAQSDKL
jgi:hypothetical protein